MATSFYSEEELKSIGFKKIGSNVLISKKASIYGASKMVIGNNVRVDDFCVLSGNITLGNYIHIAVYSALFGGNAGITMEDFSGLSSKCVIYAESDDYSGEKLTNPTVPEEYLGIISEEVVLKKHVIIGSGTTILPGVNIGTGTAVGSMSLVNKSLEEWGIYAGIPCKRKKDRSKNLLELEQKMKKDGLL
ncbi:MAG: acyltransferase [Butyrivibrio sp.]|nr:acyltransferase [Butyrivibrio sp.]